MVHNPSPYLTITALLSTVITPPLPPPVSLSPPAYLDLLCPLQTEEEVKAPSDPTGVVSLSRLKSLPIPQQVFCNNKSNNNIIINNNDNTCSM